MDKIKFTSVQTSYTRQEPISIDTALKEEDIENENVDAIRKKYTSNKGLTTKYLPAIESFGEGIFFEFPKVASPSTTTSTSSGSTTARTSTR